MALTGVRGDLGSQFLLNEHTCRVGCPNEPDSLTLQRVSPVVRSVLPRRNHLLHDVITHVFLRSLQYGIVVLGFIDTFVYAHHQHRQGLENPGNFDDCMKRRIRFMMTITPVYTHAYQATCLSRHPWKNSVSRCPKPDIRTFPTLVPQHVKEAMISDDGPLKQTEVLAS